MTSQVCSPVWGTIGKEGKKDVPMQEYHKLPLLLWNTRVLINKHSSAWLLGCGWLRETVFCHFLSSSIVCCEGRWFVYRPERLLSAVFSAFRDGLWWTCLTIPSFLYFIIFINWHYVFFFLQCINIFLFFLLKTYYQPFLFKPFKTEINF